MTSFYDAMQEVLNRPQYDILTGRSVDYQQLITEALGRAAISLLERVRLHMPDSPDYNIDALIFVFIVAAALLLLATSMGATYLYLKHRKRRGRWDDVSSSVAAIFDDIENKRFSLSDLIRTSQEYAKNNQLRDAVRYYYIAVLVSLDDNRTIYVEKSKTNAQLAQELAAAAPDLFGPFTAVINIFHEAWFGQKSIDDNKYYNFVSCVEEIIGED